MTIEELYAELYDELLAWCALMCGSAALAEDMVQEGFLRAVLSADTVMALHPAQQRAWLYRTVKNAYFNYRRRALREVYDESLPHAVLSADEYGRNDIMQLVGRLPDTERKLFVLRYISGYNSKELGQMFDMPPGTVRSHLSSARKRLKAMLKEE